MLIISIVCIMMFTIQIMMFQRHQDRHQTLELLFLSMISLYCWIINILCFQQCFLLMVIFMILYFRDDLEHFPNIYEINISNPQDNVPTLWAIVNSSSVSFFSVDSIILPKTTDWDKKVNWFEINCSIICFIVSLKIC